MNIKYANICLSLSLILILSACIDVETSDSDSEDNNLGYYGSTSQADVNENTARQLVLGVTESVSSGDNDAEINAVFSTVYSNLQVQNSSINVQATLNGSCGGTANFPDPTDIQGSVSGSITFTQYCVNGGEEIGEFVITGNVYFETIMENGQLTSMTLTINNLLLTHLDKSVVVNSNIIFENNLLDYSTTTDFLASDGRIYRIENLLVTGNAESGIMISSGRYYHPEYGYVDISSNSNLIYQECDNAKPSSGGLLLSGSSGSSAQVIFDSCSSYQVCVNEFCQLHTWD